MILVAALDGLDPDLLERFAEQGRVPNLAALALAGSSGGLRTTFPAASVPAWATFLTGVGPGAHGLFDFTRRDGDRRFRFQNALDCGVPTILELLDAAGARVASIGVPTTYPAPRLRRGAVLSGFDSPLVARPDGRGMHPLDLWRSLAGAGVDLRTSTVPEGRKGRGWHRRAVREIHASLERRLVQARALLARGTWDLLLVHFQAADTAGHHFFRYFDPGSPRHAPDPELARVMPDVYTSLDAAVGRLLDAAPAGTRCVVLSDHGMGAASDRVVHLNRWLELRGFLRRRRSPIAAAAAGVRRFALRGLPRGAQASLFRFSRAGAAAAVESRVRLGDVDLERSAAFSDESSTLPGIWLCDPGCGEALRAALRGWDEAVVRVHRRDDVYRGPLRHRAPDLLLELRHGLVRTPSGYQGEPLRRLAAGELDGERGAGLNGVHRPRGVLRVMGWPRESEAGEGGEAWIGDLAPTLLDSLGVAIPGWMEGEPLWSSRPARRATLPSRWDLPPRSPEPMTRRDKARLERRLRALGYLG